MNSIKIILIALTAVAVTSCEKFINETPKGILIPETVDDMGMILDNTFEVNPGIGNTIVFSNDIRGLDQLVGAYTQTDLNCLTFNDYLYGNNENDNDWNRIYHSISLCNFVIENIDDAPAGVDGLHERNEVKGRALLHRAYSYFLLVNEYAKHYDPATAATDAGVPLLLEMDVNVVSQRASVEDVYNQIVEDAQAAAALLADGIPEISYRPSRDAALGLLSIVYLYQGRFTESWQEARKVTSQRQLQDYNNVTRNNPADPRQGFNGLDPLEWKRQDIVYYRQHVGLFRNFLFITDDLLNEFDRVNDLRFTLFFYNRLFNTYSGWGIDRNSGISLTDIYLTEAEAAVRDPQVSVAEVLDVLNRFIAARYKTGYPPVTETDRALLKERIISERRKEFSVRGMRLFEIKRLLVQDGRQETIESVWQGQTYTITPGGNRSVMPIPLNVIDKSGMQQNPR